MIMARRLRTRNSLKNMENRLMSPQGGPRPNSMAARDSAFHFHGYTNAQKNEKEGGFVVVRGEGPYIYDEDGKQYLDGLAGLWNASLGFGKEQRLIDAAVRQMAAL